MKLLGKHEHCLLDSFKPYQRPKLSDPAHGTQRLQPRRSRRIRCSAWLLGGFGVNMTLGERYESLTCGVTLEETQRNDVCVHARVGEEQVTRCDSYQT